MERNAKALASGEGPVKQADSARKGRRDAPDAASERPWLASYPAGVDWHMPLEPTLLTALFDLAVADYGERPCTYFLGRRLSYADIGALANRAAKGLQDLGVRKGVKVGLLLPNCPSFIIYYYAVLKAGGIVVNFNPLYSVPELAEQIRDSGTTIMVTLDLALVFDKVEAVLEQGVLESAIVVSFADLLPRLKAAALRLLPGKRLVHWRQSPMAAKIESDEALLRNDGHYQPSAARPEDIAVLQYTGGTTGTPKGAMLSHANLTVNVAQVKAWWSQIGTSGRGKQQRIMAVLPFFHVFAMTTVMNFGIAEGLEIVLVPKFDLAGTLKLIHKLKPAMMPGVPTLYGAMVTHARSHKFDLTSLQFCISGGAALPLEVKQGFEALSGCHLVEGYGLSETAPVATCNPLDRPPKPGSIGIPLPGTDLSIRSLDDPEQVMPQGEPGEICIAGPQVMAGYWCKPEETAEAFVGRFFRTGDVGVMDEEGYVFIVDRIKDMINASGFKVYPRRIEEALYTHPDVEEATVIGIRDAYRGEAPKAFIKLREGASEDAAALLDFLKPRLSKLELPAEIEFRTTLPKTMVGKLSKKELVREERERSSRTSVESET